MGLFAPNLPKFPGTAAQGFLQSPAGVGTLLGDRSRGGHLSRLLCPHRKSDSQLQAPFQAYVSPPPGWNVRRLAI